MNLSGTITSTDNCLFSHGGCPAYYIISAPPLPPTAGLIVGSLFWTNQTQPQSLPFIVNMRTARTKFKFPNTTTYTVVLAANYSGSLVTYGKPQTFTWPAGTLSVAGVKLIAAKAPRIAYRIRFGKTPFRSATVTIALRTQGGKRLGRFSDQAEPGQNLRRLPKRIARLLTPGIHYRVTLKARDDLGRSATRTTIAQL